MGVNIDYQIAFDGHYYCVPYQLTDKRVDVRVTFTTVECWYRHRRVASHRHSSQRGHFTTDPAHHPKSHQRNAEWSPSRLIRWAETIGPHTATVMTTVLRRKPHPEQGFRTCLGILRLAKRYDRDRLEHACKHALALDALAYRSIKSVLETGLDREPLPTPPPALALQHANIRGATYYAGHGGNDADGRNPDEVE